MNFFFKGLKSEGMIFNYLIKNEFQRGTQEELEMNKQEKKKKKKNFRKISLIISPSKVKIILKK